MLCSPSRATYQLTSYLPTKEGGTKGEGSVLISFDTTQRRRVWRLGCEKGCCDWIDGRLMLRNESRIESQPTY